MKREDMGGCARAVVQTQGLRCCGLVVLGLLLVLPSGVHGQEGEPARSLLDDAEELVELTVGLYSVVEKHQGECPALGKSLERYLDAEQPRLLALLSTLSVRAATLDEAGKASFSAFLGERLWQNETVRVGQEGLYACLHSLELQGERRLVQKAMERFFEAHRELLLVVVGNVD